MPTTAFKPATSGNESPSTDHGQDLKAATNLNSLRQPSLQLPGATSLFQKHDKMGWSNITGVEFTEFERFVAKELRVRLSIRDPDIVASVVSDSLFKISQSITDAKLGPAGVVGFARKVVLNSARDELRRSQAHGWSKIHTFQDQQTGDIIEQLAHDHGHHGTDMKNPLEMAMTTDDLKQLEAAIATLDNPKLRLTAAAMMAGAEWPTEIAKEAGVSLTTVKTSLKRLMPLLRAALKVGKE